MDIHHVRFISAGCETTTQALLKIRTARWESPLGSRETWIRSIVGAPSGSGSRRILLRGIHRVLEIRR